MNYTKILNVLLAGAVVVLAIMLATGRTGKNTAMSSQSEKTDSAMNPAIENIMTRTSVRAYTKEAVSEQDVETMLRAAMAAPTAVNKQPWQFVVITEKALLDSIAAAQPNMHMAAEAPLAIVVCGDMSLALPDAAQAYWIQDASAATENLLLGAHALGLGAVWCGIHPIAEREAYFRSLLKLPENIVPLACVVIGHPAESPQPKDKWKPERIHHNAY